MSQVEDEYVFCELGRLEREQTEVDPPPGAAHFFAYTGDQHRYEHNEAEQVGRIYEFSQQTVINSHEHYHRREADRQVYAVAYEEVIGVPVHLEGIYGARAVDHQHAYRRQKNGRDDNAYIIGPCFG